MKFFFLREAFGGLEYAWKNAFATGASPQTPLGNLSANDAPPDPTPLGALTLAPAALGSATLPLHIISGYATASLTEESAKTLVHAFVSSRLDYCNSLLYDVSDELLQKLQVTQNAAAER